MKRSDRRRRGRQLLFPETDSEFPATAPVVALGAFNLTPRNPVVELGLPLRFTDSGAFKLLVEIPVVKLRGFGNEEDVFHGFLVGEALQGQT